MKDLKIFDKYFQFWLHREEILKVCPRFEMYDDDVSTEFRANLTGDGKPNAGLQMISKGASDYHKFNEWYNVSVSTSN